MSTDYLIGIKMGSTIFRLFRGLISYVLFVLTFDIPAAEESLSGIRRTPPQA